MFDFNYQVNGIMQNQQMLNTYFNNMQNQFTPGYKAESISFNDLLGQQMAGRGAKVKNSGLIFTQGAIYKDDNPTHMAVNGKGFFVVSDGRDTHYTRDGQFQWGEDGTLQMADGKKVMGYQLDANGNIASESKPVECKLDPTNGLYMGKYNSISFGEDGTLYGHVTSVNDETGEKVETNEPIAKVALASFANAGGLQKSGTTTFVESKHSGKAQLGVAGDGALGKIAAGSLEMSNVDFAQQAAAIGMAKQNYEANFAAFRAMDKLTESALGLIR